MQSSPRRSARLATSGSVWVTRHGERADVADGDWWRTADRPHDPPLTALGVQQAAAAGRALAGQRVDAIYASPFRRCVQTAIAIADAHGGGLKVRIEPGLGEMLHHEWFDFEEPNERSGNPVDAAMSTRALAAAYGADKIDATYSTPLFDVAERGGGAGSELYSFPEHWHEGVARYQATLARLQQSAPYSLLVTHGAGVQSCAEAIPGVDMSEMEIEYCSLTNLTRQGEGKWRCATLAAHKHTAGVASEVTNFR